MKRRFGISPLFSKEAEDGENQETSQVTTEDNILDYEDEFAQEFDQNMARNLASFDAEQDERIIDADKAAKKVSELSGKADEFTRLSSEVALAIGSLAKYVEGSKGDIKQRYQTAKENEELRLQALQLTSSLNQMQRDLDASKHEIATLRKNGEEVQRALKDARDSIYAMRNSNKKTADHFRLTMTENSELKEDLSLLQDAHDALQAKFEASDTQRAQLKNDNESVMKELFESQGLIEEKDAALMAQHEKNKTLTSELGTINRRVMELQDEKITLESRLDSAREELGTLKRTSELDQRKHDNEIYSLRSEIDNISSQWRLAKGSIKEVSTEARALRERERISKQRLLELEHELQEAQNMREKYQDQVREKSARIRELNLQYETVLIELKQEQAQTSELSRSVKRLSEDQESTQSLRIKYEAAVEQVKELKMLISAYQLSDEKSASVDLPDSGDSEAVEGNQRLQLVTDNGKDAE
ncbi:MAG: hypothetical protein AAGE61_09450 [Pseudomonadota bacterium]